MSRFGAFFIFRDVKKLVTYSVLTLVAVLRGEPPLAEALEVIGAIVPAQGPVQARGRGAGAGRDCKINENAILCLSFFKEKHGRTNYLFGRSRRLGSRPSRRI